MTIHKETYKGVYFSVAKPGLAIFYSRVPSTGKPYLQWSRYLNVAEMMVIHDQDGDLNERAVIMRRAIDRAEQGLPIYTGDLKRRDLSKLESLLRKQAKTD